MGRERGPVHQLGADDRHDTAQEAGEPSVDRNGVGRRLRDLLTRKPSSGPAVRLPIKARLAAASGGIFLLAGAGLLFAEYVLLRNNLPYAPLAGRPVEVPAASAGLSASPSPAQGGAETVGTALLTSLDGYRDDVLSALLAQSLIFLGLAALLASAVAWWATHRALRPVHLITATARRLSAQNLGQRIRLGEGPNDELRELAETFNHLLERLETAFGAQRRFVANASHELRTPMARQRALLEVALDDPEFGGDGRVLADQLLVANKGTEALLSGLLALARGDSGTLDATGVPLDVLAIDVLRAAYPRATEKQLVVTTDIRPRSVRGDRELLGRLLENLIDNAIKYNVRGGRLHVEIDEDPAVRVTNDGVLVAEEALPSLFEPFKRLAPERTDLRGSGLGLSIVRAVATMHGGRCTADVRPTGGLVVTVRLPANVTSRDD